MPDENNLKHGIPFGWHVPSQRMVSATEVANGRACECICASCSVRLKARQGAIRVWHFAHDKETDCQHAAETAIHRMAKQMIVDRSSVFVPKRRLSRSIHGKQRVWSETITADVQAAGLQILTDCTQEQTIGDHRSEQGSRRPDVLASLDGHSLAIEIRNTHAVDVDKQEWLERQGYSVLEINVADFDKFQPNEILKALEARLFEASNDSVWLAHTRDIEGRQALDQLEAQIRAMRSEEEQRLLDKLDAEEIARKRKQEARNRFKDIEDFKIGLGGCTVRVGRNAQRVSLKIHGYAGNAVFEGIRLLGRKHHGRFNNRVRCWEFYRPNEIEAFFRQLCAEVERECFERYFASLSSPPQKQVQTGHRSVDGAIDRPPPTYFDDPDLQDIFDERAAVLEFEAGFERNEAERQALAETTSLALKDQISQLT